MPEVFPIKMAWTPPLSAQPFQPKQGALTCPTRPRWPRASEFPVMRVCSFVPNNALGRRAGCQGCLAFQSPHGTIHSGVQHPGAGTLGTWGAWLRHLLSARVALRSVPCHHWRKIQGSGWWWLQVPPLLLPVPASAQLPLGGGQGPTAGGHEDLLSHLRRVGGMGSPVLNGK